MSEDAKATSSQLALAVIRVMLGFVFVMHGWQKYDATTIDGVEVMFDSQGVPFPYVAAVAVTLMELAGGVALVLGALTRIIAGALALVMAGAFYYSHRDAGFFVSEGGYELVLVLGVLCGYLAVVGAGRYSVDRWLERGRTRVSSTV